MTFVCGQPIRHHHHHHRHHHHRQRPCLYNRRELYIHLSTAAVKIASLSVSYLGGHSVSSRYWWLNELGRLIRQWHNDGISTSLWNCPFYSTHLCWTHQIARGIRWSFNSISFDLFSQYFNLNWKWAVLDNKPYLGARLQIWNYDLSQPASKRFLPI